MTPQQRDSLLQTAQQLQQTGRLREAEQLYHQILAAEPNHPRTLFMLGALAHHQGNLPTAIDWLVKAIAADPNFAETYFLLGLVHHQRGDLSTAAAAYRQTIARQPTHIKALNNLGRALLDLGQIPEGIAVLRQAITVAPQHASAHSNLGDGLRMQRDFDGAIAQYNHAITIQPNFAEAQSNLGAALAEQGRFTQSIATLRKALETNPKLPSAHYNLAKAFHEQNQFDDAIHHCRQFIQLRPDFADGHNLLGSLIGLSGQMPEAITHQQRAIALKPNNTASASNLLLSFHYLNDFDPAALFQAHLTWAAQYAGHLTGTHKIYSNNRNPNRKLRVGYVSPNFQQHSVARFLETVLPAHNPDEVEIFCYADVIHSDPATERFRAMKVHWREITKQPDTAVAATIRADAIDILVDLAGHTADNRMLLFAMKPAPIQFTWLGYPNTTGLSTIDYRITDSIADPPGQTESLHTEKLIRLEGGAWAFSPPLDSPAVSPLPAITNNFLTFGSFNNLPKVTPVVIQTWAKILIAVPNSRLIIKAMGLTGKAGQNYIRNHIARHGVNPVRLELLGWTTTTSSHLDLYNRIDIALDTFPYNGTTTTVEALWMGVPIIALAGQTHAARVSASHLTNIGLTDWIANDLNEYIKRAKEKSADIPALVQLRTNLRQKLKTSPVCDGPRVAHQLDCAFRQAWATWVST